MVAPDPERPGKRHFSLRQSIVVIALLVLAAAVAVMIAGWILTW